MISRVRGWFSNVKLIPLRITLIYAIVGGLWITLSDRALALVVRDPETLTRFQTLKGGLFVLVTAAALYAVTSRDVAAIQRSTEELRESERRFREMLEDVKLVALILDTRGNITFANEFLLDLTGWQREEVIGKSWFSYFIPEEDQEEIKRVFNELITRGTPIHYENDIVTQEGDRRTIAFSNVLLRDRQGNVIGTASIGRDITAERQAAEEIRESRRQVLDILESITDGFLALDNLWRFTYVNSKAEKLLNRKKEELLFRTIWEAFPEVVDTRFGNEFRRAVDEKTPVAFDEFYPPLNKWFEVYAYPYTGGLSIYFRDISDRKTMENAFIREKELSDALNRVNMAINSTLDFDEIMRRVVVEAGKAIGSESAVIELCENDYWVVKYVYGLPKELVGTRLTRDEARAAEQVAKTKKPFVSNDTYTDERLNPELMREYSIRSLLTIPLMVKEQVIGVLVFAYHSAPVGFSEAEVDFAGKLAVSIALALENARLYREEQKQ